MSQAPPARGRVPTLLLAGAAMVFMLVISGCSEQANVNAGPNSSDQEAVTFYSTYGYQHGASWIIPLRIWVHEQPNALKALVGDAAREIIADRAEIESLTEAEKQRFAYRTAHFVTDAESREQVILVFDDDPLEEQFQLIADDEPVTSDLNGLIGGELSLSNATAERLLTAQNSKHGWLTFQAVSAEHTGTGRVRLVPPIGLSVISDIDDTIKVTDIPAGEVTVLKRTFFEEFIAAPCMAATYRGFGADTAFHYVSGGPWQLYAPLADFLFSEPAGFPRGSFHMKNVRANPFESESYSDIWRLVASGSQEVTFEQKVGQITTLMEHFPQRTFILIGDSGERDPEVFRTIRSTFPTKVREIRIRDLRNDAADVRATRLENMVVIPAAAACEPS